ncbi:hypothetical protein [Nocardiopsis alkaliphila]|mgnify:CR=1 FL=1|uniref:hypothetical protein n=1 Tax=Nocardiopsis alkaliphila TaxID=225762 RepID=UPI00034CC484|nr:hypothetical protein [Nocardiopsis alkaliphila]
MYGLIWRILPGPWASKFIMAVGLLAGGAALLWFFAFPALSPHMPFNDGAVDTSNFGDDPAGENPGIEETPEAEEVIETDEGA